MKSKKFLKIFSLYFFSLFFVCSTISELDNLHNYTNVNISQKIEEVGEFNNLKHSSYWTLPNIYITNWTTTNKTYDWCNYENGYYIIENVTITGVPGKNGIHIENTTEDFMIRNCQVKEGVSLLRVSNGHIINNNISFGTAYHTGLSIKIGIYIAHCFNSTIENNIINGTMTNYASAIYFYKCNNIIINENTIYNKYYGGYLYSDGLNINSSENIKASNNTIFNSEDGIISVNSYLCEINENKITNSIWGIRLIGNNFTISNNTIKNSNNCGIGAKASNSTFSNNFIQNYNDYGFYFTGSNYNIISNNSIQNSGKYGIYLISSNHSSITGNFITCKVSCIKEVNCYGNIFSNNICRKIPGPIFGYNIWMILGILIIFTSIILKSTRLFYRKRDINS